MEAPEPKKKKAKTGDKAAAEESKADAVIAGASAADVRAWEGLGLGPGVLDAIGGLGFGEPTPIQRECLLPAIRDRRDVIGAAQTVRARTCRHMSLLCCHSCIDALHLHGPGLQHILCRLGGP